MVLWILDFSSARVIKKYITLEQYEEYCNQQEDEIADKLLSSVNCNKDNCEWMVTEDYVELEIFS